MNRDTLSAFVTIGRNNDWAKQTGGLTATNTAFQYSMPTGGFVFYTHRSSFPLKRSNLCAPWALPYLSHCSEWVKGLCAPKCGCTHKIFKLSYLKLSSDFLYTDGGYWIKLFISLVQQNGLSLSLAGMKLNRHLHKDTNTNHAHKHTQKNEQGMSEGKKRRE